MYILLWLCWKRYFHCLFLLFQEDLVLDDRKLAVSLALPRQAANDLKTLQNKEKVDKRNLHLIRVGCKLCLGHRYCIIVKFFYMQNMMWKRQRGPVLLFEAIKSKWEIFYAICRLNRSFDSMCCVVRPVEFCYSDLNLVIEILSNLLFSDTTGHAGCLWPFNSRPPETDESRTIFDYPRKPTICIKVIIFVTIESHLLIYILFIFIYRKLI